MKHNLGFKALLATSLAAFLSELKPHLPEGYSVTTGFKPFDLLTREQQVVSIHEVCLSLFNDDAPPLKRTAYRQATLLAVFACMERNVRQEILEGTTPFRSLVLVAHRELYGIIDHGITPDCPEVGEWNALIKSVRKLLVDEESLEITDSILDLPPELSALYLSKSGIDHQFFLVVPDDPAYFRTSALAQEICCLCTKCLNEYMQQSLLPHLLDRLNYAEHFSLTN